MPEADAAPVLVVSGLRKAYGSHVALDGVDLTVHRGEVVALVGANGAGKTTLLSIAAGLAKADDGEVRIGGLPAGSAAASRLVGFAPQDLGLYPGRTVAQNLLFFGELAGRSARDAAERLDDVANQVGLTWCLRRRVRTLSGGQKRMVHVACAFMALTGEPALVLLDEPTAGLDIHNRRRLLRYLTRLAGEGTAVCFATQHVDEVESAGETVAVLRQGRIVACEPVATLLATYGRAVVDVTFTGGGPLPFATDHLSGAQVDGHRVRLRAEDPGAVLAVLLASAGAAGATLESVNVVRPGIEDIVTELAGDRDGSRTDAPPWAPAGAGV